MADEHGAGPFRSERGSAFGKSRSQREAIQTDVAGPRFTRSKSARNPFVVFGHAVISLLFLAAILAGAGVYFGTRAFESPGPLAQEKTVLIPRGSGTTDVAETLEREGIIESPTLFSMATRLLKRSDDLKAGEYLFKPGISMRGVVDLLVEGKGIQHAITIPEGYTSEMIVARLAEDQVLSGETPAAPREGALLPDTYKFQRGTTRKQLLARMEQEQKEVLAEVWKNRSSTLSLKSPAELVTLASIVEKETGRGDERPRVASVFLNRLQKNMRLQSDPTVIYGIAGGKGKLDRSILKSDLEGATPFNTYVINGLPPGPIANPGRAAMEAVANPSQTKDLYFVADGTGGHAFAETLEQHNRNVARWRQLEASGDPGDTATAVTAPAQESEPAPAEGPQATPAAGPGKRKKRVFNDPVQNTKRDPLLNKSFDLNSPQTVPKLN
jgi:UPF0755 protein